MAQETNTTQNVTHGVSIVSLLKIVAVFFAFYFLYLVRDIILLLVIAMILASALTPLVEWLYQRVKFPRGLTVVLVYAVVIGLMVLAFSFIVPRLIAEFAELGQSIETFRLRYESEGSAVFRYLEPLGLAESLKTLGSTLNSFTSEIFYKTLGVFSGIFRVMALLVMSFYFVIQQNAMKDFIKSLAPIEYHERISAVVHKVQRKLGAWLVGQLSLMAIIFLLTFLGLSILQVKYALALGLLAGILEILPYLGPFLSGIPAVLIALLQSPLLAILVVILYTVIQQTENYFLTPKIIGKSIGANPLVVLIALLIGFKIAGFIGMLIAAPLVAVGTVILDDYNDHKRTES
ncbi:MAG: AI-2E family transporter [Candidatus Doudnabacteria bacterium]|nr:AI-2E family transporter [Candidatus Doudnabacteria bacterium]